MTERPFLGKWKFFYWRQNMPAGEWAEEGGVAVHENRASRKKTGAVHLFAKNVQALNEVAAFLGVPARWIDLKTHHRIHLDLWGVQMTKALKYCEKDEGKC